MDFYPARKISNFFKSRKLAIALIFLIILFSILGTHIPQKSQLKPEVYKTWKTNHPEQADIFEKLGFTHLFSSSLFITLAALLFINTAFCTKNMLGSAVKRLSNKTFQKKAYISLLENSAAIKTEKEDERVIPVIISVLESKGYKASQQENCIFAQKNSFGVLSTSFFHVCILFIIAAAVYGSMERMEGDMRLIEGQTLSEEHGNYIFINEGAFFNEKHQKFDITLEKFYADYRDENGISRGAAGELVISENGQKLKNDIVYSNHLVTYKGYTFLGNVYGLAPLLILMNPDGSVYSGSYITASDLDSSGRYVASFEMGDTGLEGGLMVYMTANLASEKIMQSEIEQTPILFLKIFDGGKEIYDGTLRLNDTVRMGDRYLGFYDIKYWSNFYVVRDKGYLLVYAGFGLMTLSLMISFLIIPRKVWVEVVNDGNSTTIYIGGRADKYRALYEEEYRMLVSKIEGRLFNGTE